MPIVRSEFVLYLGTAEGKSDREFKLIQLIYDIHEQEIIA